MTPNIQSIAIKKLHTDPTNPNICSPETLVKLKTNIETAGFYTPLVVIPHPNKKQAYQIVDGHHRRLVLSELGYTKVNCLVQEGLNHEQYRLLLASLNRLRGEDNPYKRAELLTELTEYYPLDALETLVPESVAEMEDLFLLLAEYNAENAKQKEKLLKELEKDVPELFNFVVKAEDAGTVKAALKAFQPEGSKDPSEGLIALATYGLGKTDSARSLETDGEGSHA